MHFKFVLVEEVPVTESAERMQKCHITELIDISFLQMFLQSLVSVQFLLLQHTGLLLHANLTVL